MIDNRKQINEIILKTKTTNVCTLGKETYTNNFTIRMYPASVLPDYCEVDKFIAEEVNGREMIAEDAVFTVFLYFINTYRPHYVEVASHVTNANHLEVTVIKRYGDPNWRS